MHLQEETVDLKTDLYLSAVWPSSSKSCRNLKRHAGMQLESKLAMGFMKKMSVSSGRNYSIETYLFLFVPRVTRLLNNKRINLSSHLSKTREEKSIKKEEKKLRTKVRMLICIKTKDRSWAVSRMNKL